MNYINKWLKKFKRRKVYSRFEDDIRAVDLAEMGRLSSFNSGVEYLLHVIDIFTKYVWVKPLKNKKAKTVLHGFLEAVSESKHKPNKLWVNQGKKFIIALCKHC